MLRDLRALLAEAKQKVPPFLLQLDEISADLLELGGKVWSWSCVIMLYDVVVVFR